MLNLFDGSRLNYEHIRIDKALKMGHSSPLCLEVKRQEIFACVCLCEGKRRRNARFLLNLELVAALSVHDELSYKYMDISMSKNDKLLDKRNHEGRMKEKNRSEYVWLMGTYMCTYNLLSLISFGFADCPFIL